jgi:hypothetical protein
VLLATLATAGAFAAVALPGGVSPGSGWTCAIDRVTNRVTVFDNSNSGTVENGAIAPTFSTSGKAYCVVLIQTYHWNGGHGASPGTLALKRTGGVAAAAVPAELGPYKASASSGQNNAPNVNWYVYAQPPGAAPQVIDGTYTCEDSGATTWSTTSKGGPGFCMVYGLPAVPTASTTTQVSTTAPTTTTTVTSVRKRKADLAIGFLDPTVSFENGLMVKHYSITQHVLVKNRGPDSSTGGSVVFHFPENALLSAGTDDAPTGDAVTGCDVKRVAEQGTYEALVYFTGTCSLNPIGAGETREFTVTYRLSWGKVIAAMAIAHVAGIDDPTPDTTSQTLDIDTSSPFSSSRVLKLGTDYKVTGTRTSNNPALK